jgi:hypothetical protein
LFEKLALLLPNPIQSSPGSNGRAGVLSCGDLVDLGAIKLQRRWGTMDLSKLPSSILVALGFASATSGACTTTSTCLEVAGCLDVAQTDSASATDSATSTGSGTDSTSSDVTTGPCLDVPATSSSTVGPCLEPPNPTTGGDTDTGGETGTGGSSSGGAAVTPDRDATIQKFSDVLPKDVLERLRNKEK